MNSYNFIKEIHKFKGFQETGAGGDVEEETETIKLKK